MEERNEVAIPQQNEYALADFIITMIKENPYAVAFSAIGLCVGILLDERRKIRKGGK